jgi:1-acyl-sn-glycerol-3-phosphate acyltransferase
VAKAAKSHEAVPAAPSAKSLAPVVKALAPVRRVIKPKFYGFDHVPKGGALLVGNHVLYGVFDLILLTAELIGRGIVARGLADHALFRIPVSRRLLTACGVVPGTRANIRELMRRGDLIMVFPGGAREVAKRKGERYQLIWKNRLGFAVTAIQGRYPIVRGIGLTSIPRPERMYFWFGEPISTLEYGGVADEHNARELRARTAASIEGGLDFLVDEREKDPERTLLIRLIGSESE